MLGNLPADARPALRSGRATALHATAGRVLRGARIELPARAFQILFAVFEGNKEMLRRLANDDPALLDFLLGVLFHYDP